MRGVECGASGMSTLGIGVMPLAVRPIEASASILIAARRHQQLQKLAINQSITEACVTAKAG